MTVRRPTRAGGSHTIVPTPEAMAASTLTSKQRKYIEQVQETLDKPEGPFAVCFMGCWDTVDAVGLPNYMKPSFNKFVFPLRFADQYPSPNNEVDFSDFLRFASNFGTDNRVVWEDGDFDADGVVGFSDFLAFLRFQASAQRQVEAQESAAVTRSLRSLNRTGTVHFSFCCQHSCGAAADLAPFRVRPSQFRARRSVECWRSSARLQLSLIDRSRLDELLFHDVGSPACRRSDRHYRAGE